MQDKGVYYYMVELKIKLSTIEDLYLFSEAVSKIGFTAVAKQDNYCVNAKSIFSIISLNLMKEFTLVIFLPEGLKDDELESKFIAAEMRGKFQAWIII